VTLNYDPILNFISINPSGALIDSFAHTITWNSPIIDPCTGTKFTANFYIPSSTPLGTSLTNSSSIIVDPGFTEYDTTNNYSTRNVTVIGSFDPNDKSVIPQGTGPNGNVAPDTRFDYLVRFQNTGTASAINVIVTDTIDDNLDLNTLIIHDVSHSYEVTTNGRVVTWKFYGINLPDSNTNEPLSHGYIQFSISPLQSLPDGTVIENAANIYFDFNSPVITNTTVNTIQSITTGIPNVNRPSIVLYPNPAVNEINVTSREKISTLFPIDIYNLYGQKIKSVKSKNVNSSEHDLNIDISNFNNGIYLLKTRNNFFKFIKL